MVVPLFGTVGVALFPVLIELHLITRKFFVASYAMASVFCIH